MIAPEGAPATTVDSSLRSVKRCRGKSIAVLVAEQLDGSANDRDSAAFQEIRTANAHLLDVVFYRSPEDACWYEQRRRKMKWVVMVMRVMMMGMGMGMKIL